MPKHTNFSRREQLLRSAAPFILLILIVTVMLWLGSKIIQGIVYVWSLISWNSIVEWVGSHLWTIIGIILLIIVILYLIRKIPNIYRGKPIVPKPSMTPSKKSGPRLSTVLWVAAAVFVIYFFKGYFVELGHKHAIEVAYSNQILPSLSAQPSIPKEVAWPAGIQRVSLQFGDIRLVPGVWYTYMRDETSLVYMKALESSSAILTTQKLGHPETYLKQRFNEFGSCKTFEDHTDGSPGKWYITTDQPVQVRITGTISK